MRILLKSLKKTFTSITLVGFIQYLILGFIFSVLFKVLFNINFLWSGFPFVLLCIFLHRLLVELGIVEERVGSPLSSGKNYNSVDKENKKLLSIVLKRTFKGRSDFCLMLLLAFAFTVYVGFLEIFYIAIPIGLLAIFLMPFVYQFLFDESGFWRHISSIHDVSGLDGGVFGGDGGCGE